MGYTPNQVAEMTPDQIIFCLVPEKNIKRNAGGRVKQSLGEAAAMADADGRIKARDAEGNLIYLKAAEGGDVVKMIKQRQEQEKKKEQEQAEKQEQEKNDPRAWKRRHRRSR